MLRTRSLMLRWMAVMASGGSLMVLETCNPQVRDTVLGGVSSAASGLSATFIQAFFEGLAQNDEDDPVL